MVPMSRARERPPAGQHAAQWLDQQAHDGGGHWERDEVAAGWSNEYGRTACATSEHGQPSGPFTQIGKQTERAAPGSVQSAD